MKTISFQYIVKTEVREKNGTRKFCARGQFKYNTNE